MANHYIEKYGKQIIREVLDIILIAEGKVTPERMRQLLIDAGIIKRSTKMIRAIHNVQRIHRESGYRDTAQGRRWEQWDVEPYHRHQFWVKNGRGQQVFSVVIQTNQIGELLEELENDTITD